MQYSKILKTTKNALVRAVNRLYSDDVLRYSIWNEEGRGWHEQWESKNSGVYASCQGLIILSELQKYDKGFNQFSELKRNVYDNNVKLIFDKNAIINASKEDKKYNELIRQRDRALSSPYKLSFFLQASASASESSDNTVAETINEELVKYLLNNVNGLCSCASKSPSRSLLATVLAYLGVKSFGESVEVFDDYAINDVFIDIVNEAMEGKSVDDVILALWALSSNTKSEIFEIEGRNEKKISFQRAIDFISKNFVNPVKMDVFMIPNSNGGFSRDTYSTDLRYVYILCVLKLIKEGLIGKENLIKVIQEIYEFSKNVSSNGYYKKNENQNDNYFWENYYVLQCLKEFVECMEKYPELEEESYINILPIFEEALTKDKGLIAVMMPFSTDWSNDFFKIIESDDMLREHFLIWRSMEERSSGDIMREVWENIKNCKFVIIDCTGKNLNVFYELGIAHTLGKPVFMCAQTEEDIPFNKEKYEYYIYSLDDAGKNKLKENLTNFAKKHI